MILTDTRYPVTDSANSMIATSRQRSYALDKRKGRKYISIIIWFQEGAVIADKKHYGGMDTDPFDE